MITPAPKIAAMTICRMILPEPGSRYRSGERGKEEKIILSAFFARVGTWSLLYFSAAMQSIKPRLSGLYKVFRLPPDERTLHPLKKFEMKNQILAGRSARRRMK